MSARRRRKRRPSPLDDAALSLWDGANERVALVHWMAHAAHDPADAGPYQAWRQLLEGYYHAFLPLEPGKGNGRL